MVLSRGRGAWDGSDLGCLLLGELSCPGTLFVSLSFGRSPSGVRVMLLCCCFTSMVNIYGHVELVC